MKNIKKAIKNYWEIFFSFINALIVAFDTGNKLLKWGWITNEKLVDISTLLFLVFGSLGIWKFMQRTKEAEESAIRVVGKMETAERQFKDLQIAYAQQREELQLITMKHEGVGDIVGRDKNVYKEVNKKKDFAIEMGIILNSFQQHIKDVSFSHTDDEMFNNLRIADKEFYKIRDDFLARGKAILDSSKDIDFAFRNLNSSYGKYADGLKRYIYLNENSPFETPPSLDEIETHPYFVEKIALGTSLRAGGLFSEINEKTEDLRALLKENL
jgi:hypothetical protein